MPSTKAFFINLTIGALKKDVQIHYKPNHWFGSRRKWAGASIAPM